MTSRYRRPTARAVAVFAGSVALTAGFVAPAAACAARDGAALRARAPISVATITLAPQAVTLPNPVRGAGAGPARRITVSLTATDARGRTPAGGTFRRPIRIRIYQPTPHVLSVGTPVIQSPRGSISFTYSGKPVANPIIVTAVSGHAFALMSFQPAHRGVSGTTSTTFPMPHAAANLRRGWYFSASFGGGPAHIVQMDTGSRGVIVPASVLGPRAIGPGPAGRIEYSSDGKIFSGHFYLTPVTLGAGGSHVDTVPIEVLGVDHAACDHVHFPKCVPGRVAGLGMMGVGFDRGSSLPGSPPELSDAFLALRGIVAGTMQPGYIVTSTGVTLGITAADKSGFAGIPLTAGGTGPGDWNTAPGCFAFPAIAGQPMHCGTVLVDTGIGGAILGLPRARRPGSIATTIPNGTEIRIVQPNETAPSLSYTFTMGDGGPMTPSAIRWAADKSPFVNTGRKVISSYDYLFDDAAGTAAFRPVG